MPKNEKKNPDKKKSKKNFGQNGVVHIKSSFNNTIVTISDLSGNDQYSFYRDAYLQRREYEINDGKIDSSLFDDEFD